MQIPEDTVIVTEIFIKQIGTRTRLDQIETWSLEINFKFGQTRLNNKITIAQGNYRYSDPKTPSQHLFYKLPEYESFEEIRAALAHYILDKFNEGEVRTEDVLNKMYELFEIKTIA